ncbi:MAG: hypothetical protein AVDCRST_MAG40-2812 [uncultured Gemmatimonadaceae bacterium]|uniref:Peptidase M15A C-terminal domain-containing protein n=1 Tax=uncultured Gemmatimonadaceae bacterium TaxID=246130 RepID=A0A6J4M3J1_9BACT|nr:MAG: hypothetical protein AVDCRST_MAG40-2812 [uncultured Gemmatimonadaceae bacterium]
MFHRSTCARVSSRVRVALVATGALAAAASPAAALATAPADSTIAAARTAAADSLLGRSGKLRARFLSATRPLGLSYLQRLLGDTARHEPGRVYAVRSAAAPFSVVTMLPFTSKVNGRLGSYRIGFWPSERRLARASGSGTPSGFIRVTPENQNLRVSEHFTLRDFLTHDQQRVWPKYLVLREELVDKLELVIADLEGRGTPVRRMVVMSGFRTPQYNSRGVGAGGRAQDSRHQYGDAADVFVDNDGDGRMDDLNRDGRVDARDAQVVIEAAERVERRHPDLVGGAGRYRATSAHGPFAHIDVRGYRARWGNA